MGPPEPDRQDDPSRWQRGVMLRLVAGEPLPPGAPLEYRQGRVWCWDHGDRSCVAIEEAAEAGQQIRVVVTDHAEQPPGGRVAYLRFLDINGQPAGDRPVRAGAGDLIVLPSGTRSVEVSWDA